MVVLVRFAFNHIYYKGKRRRCQAANRGFCRAFSSKALFSGNAVAKSSPESSERVRQLPPDLKKTQEQGDRKSQRRVVKKLSAQQSGPEPHMGNR